ncbi:ATP-binding protein, partial [Neisseria gonorrhoeae]
GMARAKAAAAEYAANFADVLQTGRSMIFSGRRGTGKNHLACGIAREVIAAGKSALVITVGDMLRTVKDSFGGGGGEAGAVGVFVKPDLLVLDEFGAGSLSETDGRILFSVVNARYERLMPMLVLTNLTAEAFRENTDARIRDRLRDGGGKLIPFDWESYRA